jgi:TrmH family RNA methyltransferase
MITSLENPRIKRVCALQARAVTRREEGAFVVEGFRTLRDALELGFRPMDLFYDPQTADPALLGGLPAEAVSTAVLRKMSGTEEPQGIVAVFGVPQLPLPSPLGRLLIIDNLRDAGNLGTMLRTAAAAGVQGVLLTPGCVDPFNPKVVRSGMGAHFRVPLRRVNWQELSNLAADLALYVAASPGETPYDAVDWGGSWGLVIGNEAHGHSPEVLQMPHRTVEIPMEGTTDSLNASVAAGVILMEALRQRRRADASSGSC